MVPSISKRSAPRTSALAGDTHQQEGMQGQVHQVVVKIRQVNHADTI